MQMRGVEPLPQLTGSIAQMGAEFESAAFSDYATPA